jgi:hypothetical protein
MENRERDRVSQRSSPTEAGDLNRRVEEGKGREHNSGTSAEFGQKIGRSENLEGGDMRNRNDEPMTNIGGNSTGSEVREDESSSRRGTGDFGSSSGRTGSTGSMGGGGSKQSGSEKWRDEDSSRDTSESSGSSGSSGSSSKMGSSTEGRH